MIAASLNCRVPSLIMLMFWYMYVPALTVQVPFTTKLEPALPGPSAPFPHVVVAASASVGRRSAENDVPPAEATRSGIVARFDEPLAETVNIRASDKTMAKESSRAIIRWRAFSQRLESKII